MKKNVFTYQNFTSIHFILMFLIAGLAFACNSNGGEHVVHNSLSHEKSEEGWILLFDGQTTVGWRGYNQPEFPANGWTVENGTLRCIGASRESGDIIYDQKFHNFRLSLEWKISEGGNSGIFYLGQEIEGEPVWKSAPEMQILDNEGHPDAARGIAGNRKAGGLYDLLPADPQNTRPAGEWNHVEIQVDRGTVVHFQNGEQVVEYQLGSSNWDRMIAESKFADMPEFGIDRPGYIALQDHGDDVWFRNIKILQLG